MVDKLVEMDVVALSPTAPEQADGALLKGSPGSDPSAAAKMTEPATPAVAQVGVAQGETPRALPQFESLSPGSSGGKEAARTKVRLARLQLESEKQTRRADREFRLQVRKLEVEADTVRMRQLELEAQQLAKGVAAGTRKRVYHVCQFVQ